ncbi:MAG: hypothetical protein U1F41_09730 [Burkholderiales bacterium]
MDRRSFISVMGALAATAGASAAVSNWREAREAAAAKVRAAGLARSAGMPAAASETLMAPDRRFVDLAFVPETAIAASQSGVDPMAGRKIVVAPGDGLRYAVRVAGLRRARPSPALQRIDVTVRYAIDEAPHFVPFVAWSHLEGTPARTSSPMSFVVQVPDRAALEVSYVLSPGIAGPNAQAGSLYLPVGGAGLQPGIYAMTTPSASTGLVPDVQDFSYTGNSRAPLTVRRGVPLDFDHFVFALRTYRG